MIGYWLATVLINTGRVQCLFVVFLKKKFRPEQKTKNKTRKQKKTFFRIIFFIFSKKILNPNKKSGPLLLIYTEKRTRALQRKTFQGCQQNLIFFES